MSEQRTNNNTESAESKKLHPKNPKLRVLAGFALAAGLGLATTEASHDSNALKANKSEVGTTISPIETTISPAELDLIRSAKKAEDKINSDIAIGNQVPVLAKGSAEVDYDDGRIEIVQIPFLTGNPNQIAIGNVNETNSDDLVDVLTAGTGGVNKVILNDATGKPIVGDLRSADNLINSAINVDWEFVKQVEHSETGNIVLTSAIHKDDSGNGMLPDGTPIGVIAPKL